MTSRQNRRDTHITRMGRLTKEWKCLLDFAWREKNQPSLAERSSMLQYHLEEVVEAS